jgi:hypothetical protein
LVEPCFPWVEEALAPAGFEVLLTPGDDDTARVYERAGLADATTMLHLRAPS